MPHGGRRLPGACLEHLSRADLILHAGDLSSLAFLDHLRSLGPPVHAVQGNADDEAVRAVLPTELAIDVEGTRIGLIHIPGPSKGREARLARRFPDCDAILYGHTHAPEVARYGAVWILNPGSPTERRRAASRSMLLLTIHPPGHVEPELVTFT
jgi:uncharacterized protein